jgi:hypothetical protein
MEKGAYLIIDPDLNSESEKKLKKKIFSKKKEKLKY